MYESLLRVVIDSWNKRLEEVRLVERGKGVDVEELLMAPRKVLSIVGPRRAGKTFFLFQLHRGALRSRSVYINFEDERIPEEKVVLSDLLTVLKEFNLGDGSFLLLDEVQRMPGWDRWVRRVYDTTNYNILVTGSTSKLMGYRIPYALAGRALNLMVLPLRFQDFLRFKNVEIDFDLARFDEDMRSRLYVLFKEFLKYGGFPEVVLSPNYKKLQLLQDYFQTVLVRDVSAGEIRNYRLLTRFLKLLANSKFFTISKAYNILKSAGYKVGKNTLSDYLNRAEEAFFVDVIPPYTHKYKLQIMYPKKVFLIDTGYITALSTKTDYGKLLENVVYLELKRRYWLNPTIGVHYLVSDGREIDFIITKDGKPREIIQVSYDISDPTTLEREITAIKTAWKKIGKIKTTIVTGHYHEKSNEKSIEIIPYWTWEQRVRLKQTI